MKRKFLVPVLILGLVFLVGVSTLAVESRNEPVNNAAQFQRAETGPGVYCGECDGEPEKFTETVPGKSKIREWGKW